MKVTKAQLRRIIREVQHLPRKDRNQRDDEVLLNVYRAASLEGTRVVVRGEKGSLYAGIGNTEGLHDFADVLAREKWQKSGSRFVQKLKGLVPGNVIQGVEGRNRFDFGTWTPQLQAMVADLNTTADLKALVQASWD